MESEDIREIFRALGPVQIRRMFGGQGVYRDELMFALVASGELYLKTDDESVGFFRNAGSRPFSYETKDGSKTLTSYWLMPESALDDPDEAAELGKMAVAAARRKVAGKAKGTAKTRKRASRSAT
ncbi:TfoX/Sxy family protein [Microvirga zambiensis]|uniref:TfoX/Sxy family protein n=1 Tax=Microvirga zambiensis TaxID=1402137 RepID=UPI00191EC897|nr:TfoX/Sxy family protein [Microvirga zambiensis]